MQLGDLLKFMFRNYFIIVTGTVASLFVSCLILNPNAIFTLQEIGRILLISLYADLPLLLFYSRKELPKKQMMIRQILHFIVLLAVLFFFVHRWDWVHMNNPKNVAFFTVQVLVIFIFIQVTYAQQDKRLADKLNDRLQERYHS